jgi:ribosomal protein S18 acetylase RimI-like enzyme
MPDISTATADDVDRLGAVLGDAFVDDPIMAWAFPDLASRPRVLAGLFTFAARRLYVGFGACTLLGDEAGTLWRPFGAAPDDEAFERHGDEFVTAIDGQVERIMTLGAAMDAAHPTEPHHYLLAIGVRPSAQGRGLGGELLRHTLRAADAAGEPAYLEASSVRSRALYERHGFEATGEIVVDDSPPMWPMWREPAG